MTHAAETPEEPTVTDERGARLWQWAAGIVFAFIVAILVAAFAFLVNANAELRASNARLYEDLNASQSNASELYEQLLDLGEQPEGEDPEDVAITAPPEPGAKGEPGDTGDRGPQGPAGPIGPQGIPGLFGPAGPNGADGIDGVDGADGATGAQGEQGPPGPQGEPGVTNVLEQWSFTLDNQEYQCMINGTPPPYAYTCERVLP
jgi:Collagen triple helix repeat (20 copies)